MTTDSVPRSSLARGLRLAFVIGGVLAILLGLLILIWPGRTAIVVTAIVAVYAITAGIVYAAIGAFARDASGLSRIGHVILGLLFIVAGIVAFSNLSATALWLAAFVGILVGVLWIVEGVVALSTLGRSRGRGFTIVFAVLSIVAGAVLLFSPVWAAVTLWLLLGISAIALGIVNIARGLSFGR